jgi:malate synthase
MAAQIPVRDDPAANEAALAHVHADKEREASAGYDGTWVAHPGLVPIAQAPFDAALVGPHQLNVTRSDVRVRATDLLAVPHGPVTGEGLQLNLDVALQYLEAWLQGVGCVPIYGLMEDAATAEISRAQVWQWQRHGVRLADGRTVTTGVVREAMARVLGRIEDRLGTPAFRASRFFSATLLLDGAVTAADCPEFLTTLAYDWLD